MHVMEPDQLLVELDLTTRTIQASEALLTKLKDRQASITSVLDAITKPAAAPPKPKETRNGFSIVANSPDVVPRLACIGD